MNTHQHWSNLIKNLMTNFFYFIHTNNHIKYKTNLIKNFIKTIHLDCYKKLLKKLNETTQLDPSPISKIFNSFLFQFFEKFGFQNYEHLAIKFAQFLSTFISEVRVLILWKMGYIDKVGTTRDFITEFSPVSSILL